MKASSWLRFGAFRLDPVACRLFREEQELPLQRQPAMVLGLLAARAPDVVRRDELQTLLWGNTTHVDFEQGLNYCIRQIRRVLHDSPARPTYIETLPRIGYRFLAQVVDEPPPRSHRQTTRAAGLLWSVTHRLIFATGSAALAVAAWMLALHLAGPALHAESSRAHHAAAVQALTTLARLGLGAR